MKDLIAYCGLDCEKCDARRATLDNDDDLRAKVSRLWSELNGVEITPEMINCVGCRTQGVKTYYCSDLCPIRLCAVKEAVHTCGGCEKADKCVSLAQVTANNAEAVKNLGLT